MWPWRRRVEVVLASSAGDDATAALTMILRYHRKPATFDEVRQAIYGDRTDANAGHVVEAAARFRLRGRGLALDDPQQLAHIPTPSIVHLVSEPGPFPRPLDATLDGFFGVLVSDSPHRVQWIDPYMGEREGDRARFIASTSGVFLVFDEMPPLPRAWLH